MVIVTIARGAKQRHLVVYPGCIPPPAGRDLTASLSSLAQGARGTAFLLEEGGEAGLDIIDQFSKLFGGDFEVEEI